VQPIDGVIVATAQWGLVIPAALTAAIIVMRRRWAPDLIEAALAALATLLAVKTAGAAIFENRPFVVEHTRSWLGHAPDNAFPSDHLAACGLAFAYLWPRSKGMALAALVAAVAIAAARVLVRLHWPLDVLCGFALGAAATVIARLVCKTDYARALYR